MVKLKLRRWHALAVMLSLMMCAQTLPLDAADSPASEPDEATLLDTATGATCDPRSAIIGQDRGVPFIVSGSAMSLAVTALEIHFVAATDQSWEDVRVQVQFRDGSETGTRALSALPVQANREVSLGPRQSFTLGANQETVRFQEPVTLAAASAHVVGFSLVGKQNGVWLDVGTLLTPCLRSGPLIEPGLSGDMDGDAVMMLKVFGVWLTPPPTLPPIPKPTDTPTPAPPLAPSTYIPVAQR